MRLHFVAVLVIIFCMVALSSLWIISSIYGKPIFPFINKEECSILVHPYESIQAAIDRAKDGDVICLSTGIWGIREENIREENIIINKPLTLRGQDPGETIINLILSGIEHETSYMENPLISINNVGKRFGKVVLENLKVVVEGREDEWDYEYYPITMISLEDSHVIINNITILGIVEYDIVGLLVDGFSSNVIVRGSNISGTVSGVESFGGEIILIDSRIMNNAAGIRNHCSNLSVFRSIISGNGVGVFNSARLQIFNSTISANYDGIRFGEVKPDVCMPPKPPLITEIAGNTIINNKEYGVMLITPNCSLSYHPGRLSFEGGKIYGKDNVIPGPQEPNGNSKGAVCPEELSFLITKRGGEYVR